MDEATVERIIPHNKEAERSVLGAAMLEENAFYDASEHIVPSDFYFKNHREIWIAIRDLIKENSPADYLTVCEQLRKRGSLEMVGGAVYIAELTDVPSTSNAAAYARIIAEKAILRKLIEVADDISTKSFDPEVDSEKMMDYAEQAVFGISQDRNSNDTHDLKEILMPNIKMINERSKTKGQITGVSTGLSDLDKRLSGLQKSDMIVLAARPSMGKTAFALTLAKNASSNGKHVLIFSLEMSNSQLVQRLISMEANVDAQMLRTGELSAEEWKKIIHSVDSLSKMDISINDKSDISILEIKNKCRRKKADTGLDLIIVDYLQLMEAKGKTESRQQEISALSRGMKQLAREMDCPVLVLSQLSRAPDSRSDHRPVLSDLRESGAIEQDADVVLFLYRDVVYNPDTERQNVCEVNVAKHRNGPTGVVEVTWLPSRTMFANYRGD